MLNNPLVYTDPSGLSHYHYGDRDAAIRDDLAAEAFATYGVVLDNFTDPQEMIMAMEGLADFARAAGGVDKLRRMLGTDKRPLMIHREHRVGVDYADNNNRIVVIFNNKRAGSGGRWTRNDACAPRSGCLGFKDTLVHELAHIWWYEHPEIQGAYKARSTPELCDKPPCAYPNPGPRPPDTRGAGYPPRGYPSWYAYDSDPRVPGQQHALWEDFAEAVMIYVYGTPSQTFEGPGRAIDTTPGQYREVYGTRYEFLQRYLPGPAYVP